jgi:diacylglycerol kinase family enzyme
MQAILCHNPAAGAGLHTKRELLAALDVAGVKARYCSTKGRDFPRALNNPADLIIAAGGDGTVAKVIANMPVMSTPLAILPLGTANNIARTFGIAGACHELAEGWDVERWRPLNIGRIEGCWDRHRFIEGVGFGCLAGTMKAPRKELVGAEKLVAGRKALRTLLQKAEPIEATVAIDGRRVREKSVLAVEIVNTRYTGPALPLPPEIAPGDGKLGVVILREGDREAVLSWLAAPLTEPIPAPVRTGRKIDFAFRGAPLHVDDEAIDPCEREQSGTADLDSDVVKVLVPSSRAK